jgi:hypothetical protein
VTAVLTWSPLAATLVALAVVALALVTMMSLRAARDPAVQGRRGEGAGQPWWGSPAFWLAVSAASLVIGVLVLPRLFPAVVIFLPFLWIRRSRRPRRRSSDDV